MNRQLELPCTGVLVECRRSAQRLRVLPASPGFQSWHVAFPRSLRKEGWRYWVRALRPVAGKYYRALGPFVIAWRPQPHHFATEQKVSQPQSLKHSRSHSLKTSE